MNKDEGAAGVPVDAPSELTNPYAAQGSLAEAWQRGYEGRPMLAAPGSNYARVYSEGKRAALPPTPQPDGGKESGRG